MTIKKRAKKGNSAKEWVETLDTTLRDGGQTAGQNGGTAQEKLQIAHALDEWEPTYIEGGWPGANPTDTLFFELMKEQPLKNATLVAFGATARKQYLGHEWDDPSLQALLASGVNTVVLFGKAWAAEVENTLRITWEENLSLVENSIRFFRDRGVEVIFDGEHSSSAILDPDVRVQEYTLNVLRAARDAGARAIVLCDTNGRLFPYQVPTIVKRVRGALGRKVKLGFHGHNDTGCAVANSLMAVECGVDHIQGTINGYGERAGNADLTQLAYPLKGRCGLKLHLTTWISRFVNNILEVTSNPHQPYVGNKVFTHAAGVHGDAMEKGRVIGYRPYEFINPAEVGNESGSSLSRNSGRTNILNYLKSHGFEKLADSRNSGELIPQIVDMIKDLEEQGINPDVASGTVALLIRELIGCSIPFSLVAFRHEEIKEEGTDLATQHTAEVTLCINGENITACAEGDGPVHALDNAVHEILDPRFPFIRNVEITLYKVTAIMNGERPREIDGKVKGSAALTRVLLAHNSSQCFAGAETSITAASLDALLQLYSLTIMEKMEKQEELAFEVL